MAWREFPLHAFILSAFLNVDYGYANKAYAKSVHAFCMICLLKFTYPPPLTLFRVG